jgi:hypothetical protein
VNQKISQYIEEQADKLSQNALENLGKPDQNQDQFLRQIAAAAVLKGNYLESKQYILMIEDIGKELPNLDSLIPI